MGDEVKSILDEIISEQDEIEQSLSLDDVNTLLSGISEQEAWEIMRSLHDQAPERFKPVLQQHLSTRYQESTQSKFSIFGLKHLAVFSFAVAMIVSVGIAIFQPGPGVTPGPDYSANEYLSGNISTEIISEEGKSTVSFRINVSQTKIPQDQVVKVLWIISGPESYTFQQNKVTLNDAGFSRQFRSGEYSVSAKIEANDQIIILSKQLSI